MAFIGNYEHQEPAPQIFPTNPLAILTLNGVRVARPFPNYIFLADALSSDVLIPADWVVDPRLQENSSRSVVYRTYITNPLLHCLDPHNNAVILGHPVDFWVINPTCEPLDDYIPQGQVVPPLLNTVPGKTCVYAIATGPVRSPKDELDVNNGGYNVQQALTFPWLMNPNGTQFLTLVNIILHTGINKIQGYVECLACNEIWGIQYDLYRRFIELGERFWEAGPQNCIPFYCDCNGQMNPVEPIVSENVHEINWLFLFLGKGIGYCSADQLRHFCRQRGMPVIGLHRGMLLNQVYTDIYRQLHHP